jgi:hypothetical protein
MMIVPVSCHHFLDESRHLFLETFPSIATSLEDKELSNSISFHMPNMLRVLASSTISNCLNELVVWTVDGGSSFRISHHGEIDLRLVIDSLYLKCGGGIQLLSSTSQTEMRAKLALTTDRQWSQLETGSDAAAV